MARIYLDEEASARLLAFLRQVRQDVADAKELNHRRAAWIDARQFFYAAGERRVLVTANRRDFEVLHDAWRRWPAPGRVPSEHAGIIVYDQQAAQRVDRSRQLALEISAIAELGDLLTNQLWVGRGGRWYWYSWTEEGYDEVLIR